MTSQQGAGASPRTRAGGHAATTGDDTIAAWLAQAAAASPDRAATWLPAGRPGRGAGAYRRTTFAELDRRCDALAAGLTAAGVAPGVRTALLVPPTEDFFALAFGLLRAGAVPVLVDPGIGARNLRTCLAEVAPEVFIGVARAHAARLALRWCPDATVRISVGPRLPGTMALRDIQRRGQALLPFQPPPVDPARTAAVLFTSGSTGVPKGVEYRHPHFLAQATLLRQLYGLGPDEVSLATFPPFALFGPPLGMTTVVPRMDPTRPARVKPRRIIDAANTFSATLAFGSPALLDRVGRGAPVDASIPSLRAVVSAGAPVAPAVQRRFLRLLAADGQVFTPYGATEALPVTTIGSREVLALPDAGGVCVGRPVAGVDVALIRVTDQPLERLTPDLLVPDGDVGEVVVRGPVVTESYAERPEATAAAKLDWDGQIAHRMGDLASVDAQGRLWFCGRKAHRVITADSTLYPVPVEAVFNRHRAVRRSALVGVGAPGAQRPVLCVQLEPRVRRSGALTRALLDLARSHAGAGAGMTEGAGAVETVLYRRRFPVDIRHNAKIDRAALAQWAAQRLR